MDELVPFVSSLDGHPVTVHNHNGQPVVIARDLGAALGYSEPGRLGKMIGGEWSADFVEGTDFVMLSGESLAAFKDSVRGTDRVDPRTPSLLILTESGLWLVAQKTDKETGRKLRRFLAEHILPKLARGEAIPAAVAKPDNVIDLAAERVRASLMRAQTAASKLRVQQGGLLRAGLARLAANGTLSAETRAVYEAKALELETGVATTALLPVIEERWFSPSEIAAQLKVTPNRIGRTVSTLGIRGADGLSRSVANKAMGHAKEVISYVYNAAAVEKIREALPPAGEASG